MAMLISLFTVAIKKRLIAKISLFIIGLLLFGCLSQKTQPSEKLIIGVVSYERGIDFVDKYYDFKDYLGSQTKTFVELEPTFNERQAIDRIERRVWSIIFAPPGLAAIAIDRQGYVPIFPLAGKNLHRSVILVREDSNLFDLEDLSETIFALGQRGSATGYYLPLYDLYGLTLAEARFAPTPRTILRWLEEETIDAGAISIEKFNFHQDEFTTPFRIIHQTRAVPSGSVLINPDLDPKLQEKIKTVMKQAPNSLTQEIGYLPHSRVPDYQQLIIFVNKVRPLENKLDELPAVLTKD